MQYWTLNLASRSLFGARGSVGVLEAARMRSTTSTRSTVFHRRLAARARDPASRRSAECVLPQHGYLLDGDGGLHDSNGLPQSGSTLPAS